MFNKDWPKRIVNYLDKIIYLIFIITLTKKMNR